MRWLSLALVLAACNPATPETCARLIPPGPMPELPIEGESTPLARRVRHEVIGRDGITLAEKWADGARSLWGMTSRGFPNMFVMPAPFQQAVVTVNYTHVAEEGAEHIAAAVSVHPVPSLGIGKALRPW